MLYEVTIKWHDEEKEVTGYLMSDSSPFTHDNDEDIFYYVKDENELKEGIGKDWGDFTLINYEIAG